MKPLEHRVAELEAKVAELEKQAAAATTADDFDYEAVRQIIMVVMQRRLSPSEFHKIIEQVERRLHFKKVS